LDVVSGQPKLTLKGFGGFKESRDMGLEFGARKGVKLQETLYF
jgi:hypothetical protein